MIKVSKKDEQKLRDLLNNLITAQKFILNEKTKIIRDHGLSTGPSEINKHAGSDLCYLYNAVNKLSVMLTEEPKTLEIEF